MPEQRVRYSRYNALLTAALFFLFVHIDAGQLFGKSEYNISFFYILSPLLFIASPIFISGFKNRAFLLLFIFLAFNLIAAFRFGFNLESTRIAIAILSFLIGYSLSKSTPEENICKLFNHVGIAVLLLITIRALYNYEEYYYALTAGYWRPINYQYLTTGGRNIEVTFLFFLSALCANKRISQAIFISAGALSIIYMSRVGVILFIFVFLIFARKNTSGAKFATLAIVAISTSIAGLAFLSPTTLHRFLDFRQEIEYGIDGIGRLGLYAAAIDLISVNYFGYGVGNSIAAAQALTGLAYKENNFHNIYIQVFIDLGIVCFTSFLLFSIWFIRQTLRQAIRNRFALLGCCYLTIGLIQFTGLDALGWLCIGLATPYLTQKGNHDSSDGKIHCSNVRL